MNNIHRSQFVLVCDSVHAALHQLGEPDLKALHAHFKGELTGDQVRSALDALRMERRLATRQVDGRTLYKAAAGIIHRPPAPKPPPTVHAPTPAPAVRAPAKPVVTTTPQGAPSRSAAAAPRPMPRREGGAAPKPPKPAAPPPKAERNSLRDQALKLLKEKPLDRNQLANALGRKPQHISVLLADLKAVGLVKRNGAWPSLWALKDHKFTASKATGAAA